MTPPEFAEPEFVEHCGPEYRDLAAKLLGIPKDDLRHAPIPQQDWFDDGQLPRVWPGDLSNAEEQQIAAEVCGRTKMEPATWAGMDAEAHIPWLRQAVATQTAGAEPAAADANWPTQAVVAQGFNTTKTTIQRWLKCGKLRDNGKKVAARRVDPASILELIEKEGLTYNET